MAQRSLRRVLEEGRPLFGAWMQMSNPMEVEIVGDLGFDWIGVDTQHGLLDFAELRAMLQAASISGTPAIVRVGSNDLTEIGRALDCGAQGIIVPLIETAEEAARAAHSCRYPPRGGRSWGALRTPTSEKWSPAVGNDVAVRFAMVETLKGLENIDAIAGVPEVDAIYVGPNDIAVSAGLPPSLALREDEHVEMFETIARAAAKAGKWLGTHPGTEDVSWYVQTGYRVLPIYRHVSAIRAEASRVLGIARETVGPQ